MILVSFFFGIGGRDEWFEEARLTRANNDASITMIGSLQTSGHPKT